MLRTIALRLGGRKLSRPRDLTRPVGTRANSYIAPTGKVRSGSYPDLPSPASDDQPSTQSSSSSRHASGENKDRRCPASSPPRGDRRMSYASHHRNTGSSSMTRESLPPLDYAAGPGNAWARDASDAGPSNSSIRLDGHCTPPFESQAPGRPSESYQPRPRGGGFGLVNKDNSRRRQDDRSWGRNGDRDVNNGESSRGGYGRRGSPSRVLPPDPSEPIRTSVTPLLSTNAKASSSSSSNTAQMDALSNGMHQLQVTQEATSDPSSSQGLVQYSYKGSVLPNTDGSGDGTSLDEFLAGFSEKEDATAPPIAPPTMDEAPHESQTPTFGRSAYNTYVIPEGSGVQMIRDMLQEHGFLHTQQIWQMGTKGLKRPLEEQYAYHPDGRVRMKRVSTLREGRRPWIPPKGAPFPHHPFQSINFLKLTLLHSLENGGLIHKTERYRPIETEEEFKAALKAAESITRKREKRAMWDKERRDQPDIEMPLPVEPSMEVKIFGWALGPNPERVGEIDEYGWEHAKQFEIDFHRTKYRQNVETANRQLIRRTKHRQERDYWKQARIEDLGSGDYVDVAREKRRDDAFDGVEHYARITGEDVSGWYEELRGELGQADKYVGVHDHPGGVLPRGHKRRAKMVRYGFPIN